jgi:hypothetical protein
MSSVIHADRGITGEFVLIDAGVNVVDPQPYLDRARTSMAEAISASIRAVTV